MKIPYNLLNLKFDFSKRDFSMLGCIVEIFSQEVYEPVRDFDFKDRVVIDVGAALGDTAIYFASKGAKIIYAFEPMPSLYQLAVKNVKMNKMEGKCKIFNIAVGKEKGRNNLQDQTFKDMFINDNKMKEYGEGVPVTTLKEIVEKFSLSNAFLKLDCEGYEYDIILNVSKEIIRKFDYIIMEYHYGFKSLKDKLEEDGFLISYTKPKRAFINNRPPKYGEMFVGYITAKRID